MPIPLDIRKKPMDVKVHVSTGAGVDITWSDAHTSHYDFSYLREHCPCATCKEGHDNKPAVAAETTISSAALPLFKPKVTARVAAAVGNYAVQIEFTDGHATGIYSFSHFREICPCEACAREFRGGKSK
ncbi:MAG: gamma-butyrobetaine hydroxylase-like domain-containing protein [Candidatus Acidiferrales bacterium]